MKRIRGLLADRGVPGLRDLALFSTAIDTMLHGQDLLALVVGDVRRRDGSMRPVIEVARRGECHQCDAPCPTHPQSRLKNGSRRPAKSSPIIYSLAVALRAVSDGSAAIEPPAEALGGRGGTRSLGLQRRVVTPDEGSPHFERHGRFADSSSAARKGDMLPANNRLKHASRTDFIPALARACASGGGSGAVVSSSSSCTSPTVRSRACRRG